MFKKIAALAVLFVSACSDGDGAFVPSFYREAGAVIDTESFGAAVNNNIGVHNGERSYVLSLATRFAEEVDSTVNFEFDSAVVDATAMPILNEQANWIRQFPEVRFRVYGHTDAVGSAGYNKALGMRRARAVVNYLVSQGVERNRLEAVVSLGKTQPLIVTQGRERKNRRTVTEVTGFVDRHPTVLDGKYAQIIYRDYVASGVPRSGLSGLSSGSEEGG
ncbi:outer membrane protein OmpA-like peptidoglycan-associated protein [Shimia isoporae]|uniref:Outer membrane protein OmpA-like peptidoglycan-associated protein n=1 Tax=Shimia isoporae TaxID=647720 RepID=A0A4R1N982_9RHOB|nr:OmpA family protein [Shimia isoporae]TCK99432.1 outer membrane protein OmpA-like peptidoglycan-associated protein [Shimia isoporae]